MQSKYSMDLLVCQAEKRFSLDELVGEWKRAFRRFYTLIKGTLGNQRAIATLIKLLEIEGNEMSPPVKLSEVQLEFDFGDI